MKNDRLKELTSELQDFYLLSFRGSLGLVRKPFYLRDAIEQMDYAGPGSLLIIVSDFALTRILFLLLGFNA